jgi:hypothetical protein
MKTTYSFKAKVWIYPGDTAWHFVNVPKEQATDIKEKFGHMSRGWSSLPVEVAINKTKWKTSIFRDKKSSSYLLPLKAPVRKILEIQNEDTLSITIKIIATLKK